MYIWIVILKQIWNLWSAHHFTTNNFTSKHIIHITSALTSQPVKAVSANSYSAFAPFVWLIESSMAFIGEK